MSTDTSPDREVVGLRVHGRVQGVGFRWWTRRKAERLGIAGTVRNADDGSVEIVASGSGEALRDLLKAVKKGPPAAAVERVETIPGVPTPEVADFRILRS